MKNDIIHITSGWEQWERRLIIAEILPSVAETVHQWVWLPCPKLLYYVLTMGDGELL